MFWNRRIWFVESGWSTDWGNHPFCEIAVFTSKRKARKAFKEAVEVLRATTFHLEYDTPGCGRQATLYSVRDGDSIMCREEDPPFLKHSGTYVKIVNTWCWEDE